KRGPSSSSCRYLIFVPQSEISSPARQSLRRNAWVTPGGDAGPRRSRLSLRESNSELHLGHTLIGNIGGISQTSRQRLSTLLHRAAGRQLGPAVSVASSGSGWCR